MNRKYVLCPGCNKKVHINDFGMADSRGLWHKECGIKDYANSQDSIQKKRNLSDGEVVGLMEEVFELDTNSIKEVKKDAN